MKATFCILLFLAAFADASSDLTRAYSYYLLKEYDTSLALYAAVNREDPENLDAYYGLMNCYIAKKQFDRALQTGAVALEHKKDGVIYAKMAYCYAKKNDDRNAGLMYSLAESIPAEPFEDPKPDILSAIGWGHYENGNYRKALQWFLKGDSLYGESGVFEQPCSYTRNARKNALISMFNGNSGPVLYSDKSVYNYGYFYSLSGSALLNRKLQCKAEYIHTDIRYKTLRYGINYDTLIASRNEHPDLASRKLLTERPFLNLNGDPDTMYITYQDYFLGESGRRGRASSYDEEVPFKPGNLWEDDFYGVLTLYNGLRNTTISGGGRFALSNIANSDRATTLFISHITSISPVSIGGEYYATRLGSGWLYQASPKLQVESGFMTTGITLHAVHADVHGFSGGIPDWQIAGDLAETFSGPAIKTTLSASLGKRIFLNESEGEFLHNIIAPHSIGFKGLVEWSPEQLPMTFYYLFKFSRYTKTTWDRILYPDYDAIVNMGGVFIQW